MTRTIQKIVLEPVYGTPQQHQFQFGAKPLLVAPDTVDPDKIAIWFDCDSSQFGAKQLIHVLSTGRDIPPRAVHCGSVVINGHAYHVFMGR